MASSGTINNTFRTGYAIRITWAVNSQSVANNTSNVTANVQLVSLGSSYTISSTATKNGSITINGTTYTFTFSAALSGNQVKTIYTKTVDIAHNADGTKTCAFSCTAGINVTLSGTYYSNVSASGTGAFNTIARASSISSLTASIVVNGTNAIAVSINRAASTFTHTVVFSFGSYSYTATNVGTSTSYAVPMNWLNAIPNSTSGTGTVTLTTYSGSTQIGSSTSRNFQLVCPDTVKPSINSIGITEGTAGIYDKFGGFVQGKSKFVINFIASGSYSSTITNIKTTVDGNSYHGNPITTGIVASSGSVGFAFIATDSRGRTVGDARYRDVIPYAAPTINNFRCERCNSDGSANNEGTYLKANINFTISSVNNRNDKNYALKYKRQNDTSWTTITSGSVYTYNSSYVSTTAILSADNGYNIMLEISDFFTSTSQVVSIGTAYTLIDFNSSGHGIAFGKVSERNAFECNMEMYDRTGVAVRNGLAYYEASGQADPDTTKEHLILTERKTPSGGFYYILTVFYSSRTGNRSQIAIPYNQATGIYFRTCFNGTWSAWQK